MQFYADHDQLFKELIREFFADFMNLFFEKWANQLDLNTIEWLDKELLPDPPEGQRHIVDLVAKLQAKDPSESSQQYLALVWIEIESADKTTLLEPRLPAYYIHLTERHGLPVLPIVLYLSLALDGVGEREVVLKCLDLEVLRFRYAYVAFRGLSAEPYLHSDNYLAVALSALMKIPKDKISQYGAEALNIIGAASLTEQKRFLLGECVEAYTEVEEDESQAFQDLLFQKNQRKLQMPRKTMIMKALEEGMNQGREEGRQLGRELGQRELLEAMLETKFGTLTEDQRGKFRMLTPTQITEVAKKLTIATQFEELGL